MRKIFSLKNKKIILYCFFSHFFRLLFKIGKKNMGTSSTKNEIVPTNFPLHKALYEQDFEVVKKLLKQKMDVNDYDQHGVTPLVIAITTPCSLDPLPFVKLLVKFGSDVNQLSHIPMPSFYTCPTESPKESPKEY